MRKNSILILTVIVLSTFVACKKTETENNTDLKKSQTLEEYSKRINSVSYSPDGKKIVSASTDKTVKIWDATTGECLKTLEGHTDVVNSASFSNDGEKIVSASMDKTMKIWDANSGECLKTLEGDSNYVHSAAFSPDGTKIVSASEDNAIKIWDINTGECLKTISEESQKQVEKPTEQKNVTTKEQKKDTETIYTVVDESAMFPGGQEELIKYLALNIKYPQQAIVRGVEGLVYVGFVVEKDGSLTNIKLLKDIGSGCGQEAIRVVEAMPKWTPAKLKGKNVRMQFNLPVKFTLAN